MLLEAGRLTLVYRRKRREQRRIIKMPSCCMHVRNVVSPFDLSAIGITYPCGTIADLRGQWWTWWWQTRNDSRRWPTRSPYTILHWYGICVFTASHRLITSAYFKTSLSGVSPPWLPFAPVVEDLRAARIESKRRALHDGPRTDHTKKVLYYAFCEGFFKVNFITSWIKQKSSSNLLLLRIKKHCADTITVGTSKNSC